MQSFSSRIWTRVAVSISYDDNHLLIRRTHEVNQGNQKKKKNKTKKESGIDNGGKKFSSRENAEVYSEEMCYHYYYL